MRSMVLAETSDSFRRLESGQVLIETLKVWVLSHNLKRELAYNSATAAAHIQIFPTFHRLHFVAFLVAQEKTIGVRPIAAQTNPSLVISLLLRDVLFGANHCAFILRKFTDLARRENRCGFTRLSRHRQARFRAAVYESALPWG
jgi:hypothetical protein